MRITRLTACVVIVLYVLAAAAIGSWVAQPVPDSISRTAIIRAEVGTPVFVAVPYIGRSSVEVATVVADVTGRRVYEAPRLTTNKGTLVKIAVPGDLPAGHYMIMATTAYALNPIRYVSQSALIAVLILEEE